MFKSLLVALCSCVLFMQPRPAAASSTQLFFPLNHGDTKTYEIEHSTVTKMVLRYTAFPGRTGVYLETDSTDGSRVLYSNSAGRLSMPGVFIAGEVVWFAEPLTVFTDDAVRTGGTVSSSVRFPYQGVIIHIAVDTIVGIRDEVTVPAATYRNCRTISFDMTVRVGGSSQPLVMRNVWTLAAGAGKIEVEVTDSNDTYIDTAELVSGTVAGRDVSTLPSPLPMAAVFELLL